MCAASARAGQAQRIRADEFAHRLRRRRADGESDWASPRRAADASKVTSSRGVCAAAVRAGGGADEGGGEGAGEVVEGVGGLLVVDAGGEDEDVEVGGGAGYGGAFGDCGEVGEGEEAGGGEGEARDGGGGPREEAFLGRLERWGFRGEEEVPIIP